MWFYKLRFGFAFLFFVQFKVQINCLKKKTTLSSLNVNTSNLKNIHKGDNVFSVQLSHPKDQKTNFAATGIHAAED